jgi:hypothetical protein
MLSRQVAPRADLFKFVCCAAFSRWLQVAHVGDALADSAAVDAPGAAGIIVDLFAEGQLIPQLTQVTFGYGVRLLSCAIIAGAMVEDVSTVLVVGVCSCCTGRRRQHSKREVPSSLHDHALVAVVGCCITLELGALLLAFRRLNFCIENPCQDMRLATAPA